MRVLFIVVALLAAFVVTQTTTAPTQQQGPIAEQSLTAKNFIDGSDVVYTHNITDTTSSDRNALWNVLNQIKERTVTLVREAEIAYRLQQIQVMKAQVIQTKSEEELKLAQQFLQRGSQVIQKATLVKSLSQAEVTIESLTGRGHQVPADSCDQILMKLDTTSKSGLYFIKDKKTGTAMKVYCQMETDNHHGGFLRIAHRNAKPTSTASSPFPSMNQDNNRDKLAYDDLLSQRDVIYMNLDRFSQMVAFDVMINMGGEISFKTGISTTPQKFMETLSFPESSEVTLYLKAHELD
jgi:hypothetical protein